MAKMAKMAKMRKPTKIFLIEKNYELLGDKLRWNDQKILDLCYATRITHEELAAMLRMSPSALRTASASGSVNKQVGLLIYQIAVSKGYFTPNPMPISK